MKITKKRMKCIKLADNEGWDTALAFLSDDLASDDEEAKKLKTARKDTKAKRELNSQNCRFRLNRQQRDGQFYREGVREGPRSPRRDTNDYGRYRDRENAGYGQGNRGYSTYRPGISCWRCGELGHTFYNCNR